MADKKKFFQVNIPLLNEVVPILGIDAASIENKRIKFDMTRRLRGKNLEARFIIQKSPEGLQAMPYELLLLPYFIRRMMRKSISYIEDSFITKTKDSSIRIKPFLITRKKVSRQVSNSLRIETKKYLTDYAAVKTLTELFSDIIENKLQKELNAKLKKIYPLALCEIRNISKTEAPAMIEKSDKKEQAENTEVKTEREEVKTEEIKPKKEINKSEMLSEKEEKAEIKEKKGKKEETKKSKVKKEKSKS